MPDMPTWVAKGSILMALDNADQNALQNILMDLQATSNSDIAGIAATHLGLSGDAENHLRNDWFSAGGWWGDVSDVIRNGFINALSAFDLGEQGRPKKLDCYWICCCSGDTVRMMYNRTGSQMVIIIRTPEPRGTPRPLTDDEPFWVVEGTGAPVHPQYTPI